jgi:hypothetical protein
MSGKLLGLLIIISLITAGSYFLSRDDAPSGKQAQQQEDESREVLRAAKNIVMHEKKLGSDKDFVIRAETITQETDSSITMNNFTIDRTDGLKISGGLAQYDTNASLLNIIGPVTIITADGWEASLTDVVWDRKADHAVTRKPVTVQGEQGTMIRGNQAEFFDDFSRIQLAGKVHAKINQNIFYN